MKIVLFFVFIFLNILNAELNVSVDKSAVTIDELTDLFINKYRYKLKNLSYDAYWSSDIYATDNNSAWYVGFYRGAVNHYAKNGTASVRCVRDTSIMIIPFYTNPKSGIKIA